MKPQGDSPLLKPPLGSRDHTLGRPDAKLVVCEFGDYQCPNCHRAQPIIKRLLSQCGEDVLFGFRHFPLTKMHPCAALAAQAAEAAGVQGKFWEMHEMLFSRYKILRLDRLLRYARELRLDMDAFDRDLRSGVHAPRIRADFSSGVRSGVNRTPTFYVHDRRFNGEPTLEALIEAIKTPPPLDDVDESSAG